MTNPTPSFHGETSEPERQILLPLTPHEYQFMVDCVGLFIGTSRGDEILTLAIYYKLSSSYLNEDKEKLDTLLGKLNKITTATVPPNLITPI